MFSGQVPAVDDLPLTQIANRLNSAASRNKPERSPSVERTTPTPNSSSQVPVAAVSVARAVTPVAAASVPVPVAAPVTTVTNVLLPQKVTTSMPFTPIVTASAPFTTVTNVPVPQDMRMPFTHVEAISAPIPTVRNRPVPQDMRMRSTPVEPIPTVTNMPVPQDMRMRSTPVEAIPTVTNMPVPQDMRMRSTPVEAIPTVTNMPVPQDMRMPFTPVEAISAPIPTVRNRRVPQDMRMRSTPVEAIPTVTNMPVPQDMRMRSTPVEAIPTVTNMPVPQDMRMPFTPVEAISAPIPTVRNRRVPQDMRMRSTPVEAIPTVTNIPVPQHITMPFTPVAAISAPIASVTNIPVAQHMTTGIQVTPLLTSAPPMQAPVNVTPFQSMMTTPTAASVENIPITTQTMVAAPMMATPTSSNNPQSGSDLVEAEIIDENTGEKVVMMLSPGQVAQLRAGALEVLPQDAERQAGDYRTTNSASGHVYGQFQETPKVRSMLPVQEMRQTQEVRDKDGTVIGVQVSPRNPCTATTRKQLLPRKPSVGALPIVTSNQGNITEASTSSQGGVQPEVMRWNLSGLPVEHVSEESESETLMFCDGANDEKPKKKKMRLSGPACAQLRRSSRSTPAREVRLLKFFSEFFMGSKFLHLLRFN